MSLGADAAECIDFDLRGLRLGGDAAATEGPSAGELPTVLQWLSGIGGCWARLCTVPHWAAQLGSRVEGLSRSTAQPPCSEGQVTWRVQ